MVGDHGSKAKGKLNSVILLVERDKEWNVINYKAFQVDGKSVKEDTFYKLKDGELVEVTE